MRAAIHDRYGPPTVVRVAEVPKPRIGRDEILVRVRATTVNRTDCGYRGASPFATRFFTGLRRPRRKILGTEYAGEIVQTGPSVTRFRTGQRVFGYNEGPFGAHAEYLAVAEDAAVASIPDGIDFELMAPSTEGAHYALINLRRAGVEDGSAVLVNGATGAIGSAAVQLAKALGARVTAVCPGRHVDLVRGLGADRVVDCEVADFTDDEDRYDFVFDAVGKTTFRRCRHLLVPGGIFASTELGPKAQNLWFVPATRLASRRVIFAFPFHNQKLIEYLGELVASGDFRPLVDRVHPLEEIVDAYEYVETGQKVGNVVITV